MNLLAATVIGTTLLLFIDTCIADTYYLEKDLGVQGKYRRCKYSNGKVYGLPKNSVSCYPSIESAAQQSGSNNAGTPSSATQSPEPSQPSGSEPPEGSSSSLGDGRIEYTGTCGLVAISTSMGISMGRWMGGWLPVGGEMVVGPLNHLGMVDVGYSGGLSGRSTKFFIENMYLTPKQAQKELIRAGCK